MKIGIITNAFNEPNLIKGCIKQFEGFDFDHLVLCSLNPWHGNWKPDNTHYIAASCGARVYTGMWKTEEEQFNWGLKELIDYDWVLIVDADERYEKKDIENMVEEMEIADKIGATGLRTHTMNIYWKTPEYRIITNNVYFPVIAVKPNVCFYDKRNSNASCAHSNALLYHFSYVRSNLEMKKKINTFSHAHEFDKEKWFTDKWLNWQLEDTALHPVIPWEWQCAIYDPCPEEIAKPL